MTVTIRKRERHTPPSEAAIQPAPEFGATREANSAIAYTVGNKRPPIETRFGGPRGNQPGRRKGSKGRMTVIDEELNARVFVQGQGRIPKFRVAVRQLVNKAASGDLRAINQLLRLVQDLERLPREVRQPAVEQPLTAHQMDIFDIFTDIVREEMQLGVGSGQIEEAEVDEI